MMQLTLGMNALQTPVNCLSKLMWCLQLRGNFICYNHLLTRRTATSSFDWKPGWKLKLAQRVFLSGWKISCTCLPTKDNLVKRHIPLDICKETLETVVHQFSYCEVIRPVLIAVDGIKLQELKCYIPRQKFKTQSFM